MKPIIKYIFLTALRDKLFLGIFVALIFSFALSIFFGSTSLIEKSESTTAYIAATTRIIIIVGMILFVCLSISRAFINKEIEFILSKAISREQLILSYLAGFLLVSLLIIFFALAIILLISHINKIGALIWFCSLFFELWIIISFAILTALIFQNYFASIFSTLLFYLTSRLMGVFVLAINLPENFAQAKNHLMPSILKIISVIFPRLDLFGQSEWLIYGVQNFSIIAIIGAQSLIYIALMLFMSFRDFRGKQF